jgi:hypothetical protein
MIKEPGIYLVGGQISSGIGYAVQLYIDNKPFLAVGPPNGKEAHLRVLEAILEATGTPYKTHPNNGGKQVPMLEGRVQDTPYQVVGMSMARVPDGPIALYGQNKRLKMGPDQAHLDDLAEYSNGNTPEIE